MGGFDEYKERKQLNKMGEFYIAEGNKSLLDADRQDNRDYTEYFTEHARKVFKGSTFEERTRYYFEDYHLLRAKAERYSGVAQDTEKLKKYSKKYGYRGSRKRKEYAMSASVKFNAAADLEAKYQKDVRTGKIVEKMDFALFQHREKVIRARLEALMDVAMVKAQNSNDEAIRCLKSKHSCLHALLDQLNEISRYEQTEKDAAKFAQAKTRLMKELGTVQSQLRARLGTTISKWTNENSLDSASIKAKTRTARATNPDLPTEGILALEKLKIFAAENDRPEYVQTAGVLKNNNLFKPNDPLTDDELKKLTVLNTYTILRDRNGFPVNKGELRKDEWNKKWINALNTGDEKTKNMMLEQRFNEITRMQFPSAEELQRNGIMSYFNKRPGNMADFIRIKQGIDALFKADPDLAARIKNDRVLAEKLEHMKIMDSLLEETLGLPSYMIIRDGNGTFKTADRRRREINAGKAEAEERINSLYDRYKKSGAKLKDAETEGGTTDRSFEELKKAEPRITKDVYNMMQANLDYEAVTHDPELNKILLASTMSRWASIGIRMVHYDKNHQPLTEKDRLNQEWNRKWLTAIRDNDQETEKKMLEEEGRIQRGFSRRQSFGRRQDLSCRNFCCAFA